MSPAARILCAVLAVSLSLPVCAQQKEAQEEKVEAKIIWGVLLKLAFSKLSSSGFEIFVKWVTPKLTGGGDALSEASAAGLLRDSGARIVAREAGVQPVAGRPEPAPEVVVANPDKPLRVEGGEANYEGVHIALMMAQDGGRSFVFRPVSEGFRTGERFKLRVVSTFGGEATIENINPRGERRQIYPPRPDQVVTLVKGSETLLPLGADQYFEFSGDTGREQLVINVADRRAVGPAAARTRIFRQDTRFGSNFLQEVAPGSFPLVQQAIELTHSGRQP